MNKMELLQGALEYIENHLESEIKTEDVARACYCSKSTLEKLFRCVNHVTVREYMIRRRMMKAAKRLLESPEIGILEVALQYGYSTNESFTRAFKQVWNCKPSEFRSNTRFWELFPRIKPLENGEECMNQYKQVDISELYDLFQVRKDCYFVCCDIKHMISINKISRKAGDLAILEAMKRMEDAAGMEDIVFRIGGDEFVILTNTANEKEAQAVAEKIRAKNGKAFSYTAEDGKNGEAMHPLVQQIPLNLYVSTAKFPQSSIRYHELFAELHTVIEEGKEPIA